MPRTFPAFVLACLLILPACGYATSRPHSVQPLQVGGQTFCTAFSINEREGYWATAAHCAVYGFDKAVTILGLPAHVVFIGFPSADIAVFQGEATAPALRLADGGASVGDPISIVGFPYGIVRTKTFGHMAALRVPIIHPSTEYYMTSDILDITVAGGNSGSPIFDRENHVIGVLWGGFSHSPHALGVPYAAMKQGLAAFWD